MRVIIINDSDGHCHVLAYTAENLRKCLQHLMDTGFDFDDEATAAKMCVDESATAEQIEDFMRDYNAPIDRSGGGQLYIEDVVENWDFRYGPWD